MERKRLSSRHSRIVIRPLPFSDASRQHKNKVLSYTLPHVSLRIWCSLVRGAYSHAEERQCAFLSKSRCRLRKHCLRRTFALSCSKRSKSRSSHPCRRSFHRFSINTPPCEIRRTLTESSACIMLRILQEPCQNRWRRINDTVGKILSYIQRKGQTHLQSTNN